MATTPKLATKKTPPPNRARLGGGSKPMQKVANVKDFNQKLFELGEELRTTIELECQAWPTNPQASCERAERVQNDYAFFVQNYFPHYVPTPHFSAFHQFIFKYFPQAIDSKRDARDVIQAPRGEAKTTYCPTLGALWCIVTNRKHLIVLIMNTEDQAIEVLESIKAELDTNPRLKMDFPHAFGQGRIWQATTVVTANNIKIRTGGTGKKLRGIKHGAYRPDLIFLDDLENDENVKQKEQRDKVEKWVLSAITGLAGPAGGMDIFWVGTSLHYDAAINRVGRAAGWRSHVFKSIIAWPNRMDLWDKWEAIYKGGITAEEKQEAEDQALAFYQVNKAEMDAGAIVSWQDVRPLYRLMAMRAVNHEAFNQEQQNQAGNSDNAPFKGLKYWTDICSNWMYFGSVDPSLGKGKLSDPSAILVGGFDRKNMRLDVIEADVRRRVPQLIVNRVIELQKQYGCIAWSIEAVQFQSFLCDIILKEGIQQGVVVPVVPVLNSIEKELRILSLQPQIQNGLIRLGHNQTTAIEQITYWPEATHDDAPDCLEMLWRICQQFTGEFSYTPVGNARHQNRYTPQNDWDDWDDE